MILTPDELRSLIELKHQSPHTLLGMHPLGDGSGLVVRAFLPDAAAREKLETILHPRIGERWLAQIETWRGENRALAVVVIPLLFETRAESHFDKIICVACSAPAQRERLLARGWTPEQIQQRLAAQWPVEQKISRADFVVWTDGALDAHVRQLERIFVKL